MSTHFPDRLPGCVPLSGRKSCGRTFFPASGVKRPSEPRAPRSFRGRFWTEAALISLFALAGAPATAQQYGPPPSGSSAAILFVPATLNLVAGLNGAGYGGDGGLANSSLTQLDYPVGMAYDSNGNLFIADESNYIVRRIDHITGDISTFAGTPQTSGGSLGGGVATSATLGLLSGLVIDSSNNVYVADRITNNVVWKITPGGTISIFAGGGSGTCTAGATDSIGDGCPATDATLDNPWGLGIDSSNNIYIADSYNHLIREISSSTGIITAFAGDTADAGTFGCNASLYSTSTPPYTPAQAHLCFPFGIAFDTFGNAYISESDNNLVRVVTKSTGNISVFAGGGSGTCSTATDTYGNGCPAADAIFDYPAGVYVDPGNRVYIADDLGDEIRMVDSSGNISIILGGNGSLNKYSPGEPDTEYVVVSGQYAGAADGIDDFTLDPNGNIVATDSSGAAVTSAGSTGQYVFPETNIFTTTTTTSAHTTSAYYPPYILISNPSGVTLNFTGTPTVTGPFAVVTGTGAGTCTFPGTLAAGQSCTLVASFTPTEGGEPGTLATGSIVIDSNANGSPSTITLSGTGVGNPTTSAELAPSPLTFTSPANVTSAAQQATLTNNGQVPIAIGSYQITGVSASNFAVSSTTCPSGSTTLGIGDSCTYSITFTPSAVTTYAAGFQVCISTSNYGCINSVNLNGTGTGVGAPMASLNPSSSYAFSAVTVQQGAQSGYGGLPAITLTNTGTAPLTFTGSTPFTIVGPANTPLGIYPNGSCTGTYVEFNTPLPAGGSCTITVQFWPQSAGVFAGTLSVADNAANSPQTLSITGIGAAGQLQFVPALLSPFAGAIGTGSGCHDTGDGGPATGATLCGPGSVATDQNGNTYIADMTDNVVRLVNSSGVISDFAGFASVFGTAGPGCAQQTDTLGDGCPALDATLSGPVAVAVDGYGNLYISDFGNYRIREVNAKTNIITTFYSEGPGKQAYLTPGGLAFDPSGNLYVATGDEDLVVRISPSGGGTLFAGVQSSSGAGENGYNGDGIAASTAELNDPTDVASDLSGNIYIADMNNYRIRKVSAASSLISTVAGNGTQGNTGDGGPATQAEINAYGVAVDAAGDVYISGDGLVRQVNPQGNIVTIAGGGTGGTGGPATSADLSGPGFPGIDLAGDVLIPSGAGVAIAGPQGDLVFGSQGVGTTSAAQTLTLTNTGNATVNFYNPADDGIVPAKGQAQRPKPEAGSIGGGVGAITGDFAVASGGTCNLPTGIAAGTSCTLNVTFTPTASGSRTGTITLYTMLPYNSGTSTVQLSGTGTTAAAPTATLTPATLAFPGTVVGASAPALAATLSNTGTSTLTGITPSITGTNAADFALSTGTNACGSTLAAGSTCSIYVTFTPASSAAFTATLSVADNATGAPQTASIAGTGVSFVSNVGMAQPAQSIGVFFTAAGTLSSIQTFTRGASSLDYTTATGGTCAAGTAYTVGQFCTVNIVFTPKYPGLRNGAVLLSDGSGNILGSTYLPGIGDGPQLTYTTGATTTAYSTSGGGPYALAGIAMDENGNIYGADGNNDLIEIPFSGSAYGSPEVLLASLSYGPVVAIDGAGSLIYTQNSTLLKLPWNGAAFGQPSTLIKLGSPFVPNSIAVDGYGNIFFTDLSSRAVYEIPLVDGAYPASQITQLPFTDTGANTQSNIRYVGLAFDVAGNLYVGEGSGDVTVERVLKLPRSGSGWGTQVVVASGLANPQSVAVDPAGNVVIANNYLYNTTDNQAVGNPYTYTAVFVPWNGTTYGAPQILPINITYDLYSLAMNSQGSIFVGTAINSASSILQFNRSVAPSLTFASTPVGSTSSDSPKTVPILNIGNAALTISGSTPDPTYPTNFPENTADTNLCGASATLAAGGSCDVSVDFKPTTSGNLSGNVVLTENSLNVSGATQSIPVSGTGTSTGQPTAVLSPSTFAVGSLPVGTTSGKFNFTLSNADGTATLTNIVISIAGANPSDFALATGTQACGSSLAAGAYCYIYVTFTPASAANFTATLTVTDNAVSSPQTATMTGTGTPAAAPVAALTPTTLSFGSLTTGTTSAAMQARLSNSGTATLTGITPSITGTNTGDFALSTGTNACGSTLAADSSCYFYITFTPASATSFTATLSVADNATGSPQTTSLTGTGTAAAAPVATLSPATLSFGNQTNETVSPAMTATLKNTGNATLNITGITIAGANPSDFAITTGSSACGTSLAAGSTCNIYVTFTPASVASFTATLSVADNAAGSPQTASLTGTGTVPPEPVASLSPATLSFGNETDGTTSGAMTAVLSNTGNATLNISLITISGTNPADFAISTGSNACGSSLAAGSTCNIYITFTPASAASFTATLSVQDNGGYPQTATLTGTGTVPAAPAATLSPTTLSFGNETDGATSGAMTATLSNSGNATLSITGITITGANPSDFAIGTGSNACGSSLAADASCTIYVTFTPASAASFTATLSVADNASGSPQTSSLSGTGVLAQGNFTVSSPTSPQTVTAGGAAQYNIVVAVSPSGDVFSNPVTLSASGLPAGATASFNPASVTPGTSSANSTMTVQTAATALTGSRGPHSPWPLVPSSLALVFGGAWAFFRRKHPDRFRGRFGQILSLLMLLAALGAGAIGLAGCGGGFALNTVPKPQTYTITVTGTSGEQQQSTTVQLTVE
jgi:trimeric autotransporter adhesin